MEEVEDDKKVFEPNDNHEDDTLPDPDEQLMLDQGNGRVWLVKIPKFLMERWSAIDAEDTHLATIRVYSNANGANGSPPRIVLFLPPNKNPNNTQHTTEANNPKRPVFTSTTNYASDEPDQYELDMVNDAVENQIVVAERPKDSSFSASSTSISAAAASANSRARTTILTGRIKHECNLRPVFTENYRRQMKERTKKYNTPRRQIMMIEEAGVAGGRGGINRLSSGVGVGSGNAFSDLIKSKPKPVKGNFERMARMPRNQLLDLIFQMFRETERWGLRPMRERTQQPEVYLKEVLSEVAILHRSGEYNGLWELKENFKEDGVKAEAYVNSVAASSGDVTMENMENMDEDEDEDDDDDDDMEEVS